MSTMSLDDLLDALENIDGGSIRSEIRNLRAVKWWALERAGIDYGVDDRVMIRNGFRVDLKKSPGWVGYEEALCAGALAVVRTIEFDVARKLWYVTIRLDREWVVTPPLHEESGVKRWWHGSYESTPVDYEPPSDFERERYPEGRKHTFALRCENVMKWPQPRQVTTPVVE